MQRDFIRRLSLPIIAGSLLLFGLGVTGAWYTYWLQEKTSELVARGVSGMRAAEEFEIGIREVRSRVNLFRLTQDRKFLDEAAALRPDNDYWLARAEQLAASPEAQQLLDRVRQGYARLGDGLDRVARRPVDDDLLREVGELIDARLTHDILTPAHELLEQNEQAVERASADNQVVARRAAIGMLVLGGCGALGGLLGGLGLARALSRSIIQLSLPVRDVAGQLNQVVGPIHVTAGRDLGELETALRAVAGQVEAVVRQLQQSQQEVLRAEQLARVGQLAAGMAHELLNPLMAIEVLVDGNLEEALARGLPAEDLRIIREQIDRLERSLRRFLDFARPPRLERRPLSLHNSVEQTLALVQGRARQQGVELKFDPPTRPAQVEADREQIQQLLLNLCWNALDAMPRGGVLELVLVPSTHGIVELHVLDTGPGLAAAIVPRLFEAFASTKETGMGLGLAVSRRIAESHGGTLSAANHPAGGAWFVLRLPLAAEPAPDRTDPNHDPSPPAGPHPAGHR